MEYPGTGMIEHTYPLRDDVTVRVVLPRDLKLVEVDRIVAFLSALTLDLER